MCQLAAESVGKMFAASLIVLLLCGLTCLPGQSVAQTNNATAIDEALLKGQQLESLARDTVKEQFPPTPRAQAAAESILDTMHMGLEHCAAELKKTFLVPQYETCIASINGLTKASLGQEAGQQWAIQWATSGASRMGFFFW